MRALRSTSLVRRVTPCGWRSRRRRRRFQSEKVENGLRHRRASARVRRIERLRRSRNLARHLKPSYRVKKTRFDAGIARAQRAIPRYYWPRRTSSSERALRGGEIEREGPSFIRAQLSILNLCKFSFQWRKVRSGSISYLKSRQLLSIDPDEKLIQRACEIITFEGIIDRIVS